MQRHTLIIILSHFTYTYTYPTFGDLKKFYSNKLNVEQPLYVTYSIII